MKYEIEAAAKFLTKTIFPDISAQNPSPITSPRSVATSVEMTSIYERNIEGEREKEKAQVFYKMVCKMLAKKFASHWYEDKPIKGQAYRSILVDCENNFFDKVILSSAHKSDLKNVEMRLKQAHRTGFQMWIDPGEVEVEFLAPSSLTPTSSYKSRVSNEILYSVHSRSSARPPSPPSPSSSPSLALSSSPPSSPAPSSYSLSSSSSPSSIPFLTRQNKPIRISQRQNDDRTMVFSFDKNLIPDNNKEIVMDRVNTLDDNINNVKSALAFTQCAM